MKKEFPGFFTCESCFFFVSIVVKLSVHKLYRDVLVTKSYNFVKARIL